MAPDPRTKKVGLIVGSLREHSFNRMIAAAIPELEASIAFESISLADLPLYNEDLDHGDGPNPSGVSAKRSLGSTVLLSLAPNTTRAYPAY